MHKLVQKVYRSVQKYTERYETVVVAFSGGKDSMALAGALKECGLGLTVVLAHVDHGIRPESGRDADKAAEFATENGFGFVSARLSLPKDYSEDDAREARYEALFHMAKGFNVYRIFTAHSACDQLETMLMRLCRGTGTTGMAGISMFTGNIVRPLLNVTHAEIKSYLEEEGWVPIEDSSNSTDKYTRNRFRAVVVPFFRSENGKAEEAAANSAQAIREDVDTLNYYLLQEWDKAVVGDALDSWYFNTLPRGMRARILTRLFDFVKNKKVQLSYNHIDSALRVIEAEAGNKLIQLPGGVSLYKKGRWVEVRKNNG